MSDLISRSELLKKRTYMWDEVLGTEACVCVDDIEDALAVDAVPVVRCKDCKHWGCYGGEDSHKGDCSELVGLESCMYEDDFCSYGERRDNG